MYTSRRIAMQFGMGIWQIPSARVLYEESGVCVALVFCVPRVVNMVVNKTVLNAIHKPRPFCLTARAESNCTCDPALFITRLLYDGLLSHVPGIYLTVIGWGRVTAA